MLISAYCNDTICYGTLGSGWIATCINTQVQAELHLNFADQIRKNIVENLQINTLQLEDQLKQVNQYNTFSFVCYNSILDNKGWRTPTRWSGAMAGNIEKSKQGSVIVK